MPPLALAPEERPLGEDLKQAAHSVRVRGPFGADAGCFDTDDGAHSYLMRSNVCFFGGHKSLDGHSKTSQNNLYVFPAAYGAGCVKVWHVPPIGTHYEERFENNTCILPSNGSVYASWSGGIGLTAAPFQAFGCPMGPDENSSVLAQPIALSNNTIYVPEGDASVACSIKFVNSPAGRMPLAAYQQAGNDRSTKVVQGLPTPMQVELWAQRLLN